VMLRASLIALPAGDEPIVDTATCIAAAQPENHTGFI
jgi:hypothetical protein